MSNGKCVLDPTIIVVHHDHDFQMYIDVRAFSLKSTIYFYHFHLCNPMEYYVDGL